MTSRSPRLVRVTVTGIDRPAATTAWLARMPAARSAWRTGAVAILGLGSAAIAIARPEATVGGGLPDHLLIACAGVAVLSFSVSSAMGMVATIMQEMAPDELRGRVMSVYILLFQGGFPIGALVAGYLAGITSEALTVYVFACVILVVAIAIQVQQPSIRNYN